MQNPVPLLRWAVALSGLVAAGCRPQAPRPADYARLAPAALEARAAGRDARALRELAYRSLQSGHAPAALGYIQDALQIEPGSSDAYNIRGMIYASVDKPEQAV